MKNEDRSRHDGDQYNQKQRRDFRRFCKQLQHGTHLPALACSPCVAAPMDLVRFALPVGHLLTKVDKILPQQKKNLRKMWSELGQNPLIYQILGGFRRAQHRHIVSDIVSIAGALFPAAQQSTNNKGHRSRDHGNATSIVDWLRGALVAVLGF